jgi:hypothetical protein
MATPQFNNPIRIVWRKGDDLDPYILKEESLKVIQNKIVLDEIPDEFYGVRITGFHEVFDVEDISSESFLVNYQNGIVTFDKSQEGVTLVVEYKGRGILQYPAERIYSYNETTQAIETLQEMLDKGKDGIDALDSVNDAVNNAQTATSEANASATLAQQKADLAQQKADLADSKANLAQTATTDANTVKVQMETHLANSVFLGNYDPLVSYKKNNVVRYDNAIYINILDSTGVLPTNSTNWQKYLSVKEVIENANLKISELNTNIQESDQLIIDLDTAISNANTKITETETARQNAISATTDANTATNNATTQAGYAKTQGDYAKTEGDKAKQESSNLSTLKTNVESATNNANTQATYAKNQGDRVETLITDEQALMTQLQTAKTNAETATQDAINAKNDAVTATTNANTQANYAETQADRADYIADNFRFIGDYDSAVSYLKYNLVRFNGSTYICTTDSLGNEPTDTAYWQTLAIKGVDGKGNVESVNGKMGVVVLGSEDIGSVENGGNVSLMSAGSIADRPSTSADGHVFINWDDNKIYRYSTATTSWIMVGGSETIDWSNITNKPSSYPASMITESTTKRFSSDTEKARWNDTYTKTEVDNKISTMSSGLEWKQSVATFADIATTYPNPEDGWTVSVKDTDITYRYTGTEWIAISANSIPIASTSVDGKMSKEQVTKLESIENGAEVNQNAFSTISAGGTLIYADTKTDTLHVSGGTGISVTGNAGADQMTISVDSTIETTSGAQTKANTAETNAINFVKSYGLGDVAKSVASIDINTININGLYYVSSGTNRPIEVNGWLIVNALNSSNAMQMYYPISSSSSIYVRRQASGTWTPWIEMESTTGSQAKVDTHANKKDNPHQVTKTQVGLGNVDDVQQASKTEFDTHNIDSVRHITSTERETWNAKETTTGAQTKANTAESNANNYTDTKVTEHTNKTYVSETPPTGTMKIGDQWFVVSTSTFSIWDGTAWRELSVNNPKGTVDFSTNDARLVIPVGVDKYAT